MKMLRAQGNLSLKNRLVPIQHGKQNLWDLLGLAKTFAILPMHEVFCQLGIKTRILRILWCF
jgi:hypothetical protein